MDSEEGLRLVISNIKKIRQEHGLTKRQVAERVGLNYSNYCRIENNKVNPRFTTVVHIAESLDVNLGEIFKGCY